MQAPSSPTYDSLEPPPTVKERKDSLLVLETALKVVERMVTQNIYDDISQGTVSRLFPYVAYLMCFLNFMVSILDSTFIWLKYKGLDNEEWVLSIFQISFYSLHGIYSREVLNESSTPTYFSFHLTGWSQNRFRTISILALASH